MNKELARAVITSGVNHIQFSIDGYQKETYENIRIGASYEEVIENLIYVSDLIKKDSLDTQIEINYIVSKETREEVPEFFNAYNEYVNRIHFIALTDFWGKHSLPEEYDEIRPLNEDSTVRKLPCIFLWESLCVSVEGRAMLCTQDYRYESRLSNICDRDIREIWSEDVQEIRKKHLAYHFDFEPCDSCYRWAVSCGERRSRFYDKYLGQFRRLRKINELLRPVGFVDIPQENQVIRGFLDVMGWALSKGGKRIRKIEIKMGAKILGEAQYGDLMRPDVTYAYQDLANSWFPGFRFRYDISCLENGIYEVEALATDTGGIQAAVGNRKIYVEHS